MTKLELVAKKKAAWQSEDYICLHQLLGSGKAVISIFIISELDKHGRVSNEERYDYLHSEYLDKEIKQDIMSKFNVRGI